MGRLRQIADGKILWMRPLMRVGRDPSADVVMGSRLVSAEHALIRWVDMGWTLRDLGSRNGTWVDGRKLSPGEEVQVFPGAMLAFGGPDVSWMMLSEEPPGVAAENTVTGHYRHATSDILVLPDDEQPTLTVQQEVQGGWVMEDGQGSRPVLNGDVVEVDGQGWRIHLPEVIDGTWESTPYSMILSELTFQFRVSMDEEHVDLTLQAAHSQVPVAARAHHYLLLTLSRARLADQAKGLPTAEQGWKDQDELARRLGLTENMLNVYICRARQQLATLGVLGAGGLIERRSSVRKLRLGAERAEVRRNG